MYRELSCRKAGAGDSLRNRSHIMSENGWIGQAAQITCACLKFKCNFKYPINSEYHRKKISCILLTSCPFALFTCGVNVSYILGPRFHSSH